MSAPLAAFRNANFHWVCALESIWSDNADHAPGPNDRHIGALVADLVEEGAQAGSHPLGRVLIGRAGIGKTHLMSALRAQAWEAGCWFVLLDVLGLNNFWRNAALSFLTSLLQETPNGRRQFEAVLTGVARRLKVEKQVELAFNTPGIDPKKLADILLKGLKKVDLSAVLKYGDVFRALCVLRCDDLDKAGLAHAWLQGYDSDPALRQKLGLAPPPPPPDQIVRGISWIMSLAGPTFVAVDQIDGIIQGSVLHNDEADILSPTHNLSEILAAGLLELSVAQTRAMIVIACLESSWKLLEDQGMQPFLQRFQQRPLILQGLSKADHVRELIVQRLAPAYQKAEFQPPYPSWPFTDQAIKKAAFAEASPRAILMGCDAFRRNAIENGIVGECTDIFGADAPALNAQELFDLKGAMARADISGVFQDKDDTDFGQILFDAFEFYSRQFPPRDDLDIICKNDPAKDAPPLHGRLTFTHHDDNDREQHFCFRALQQTNANAFQARLRAALTASGISVKIADRSLILARRGPIPGGPKTQQLMELFLKAGGKLIDPSDDDLRGFVALKNLEKKAESEGQADVFAAWLMRAQPLLATEFFRAAQLSPPPVKDHAKPEAPPAAPPPRKPVSLVQAVASRGGKGGADKTAPSAPLISLSRSPIKPPAKPPVHAPAQSPARTEAQAPGALEARQNIPIGVRVSGCEAVTLRRDLLPRHIGIIAGSGSGKTVLLRRIVEEAALNGVPAIVIDPNNDLSQLGLPWRERPASFTRADDAAAKKYQADVEVLVWTPGVSRGNPLSLSVMPDFSALGADIDERDQAIEMACETLAPLANAKTKEKRGVLASALRRFAGSGGGALSNFINLLEDLPEDASKISTLPKLARQMADSLYASMETNPLLRTNDALVDPSILFYGPDRAKTRISVINLAGLSSDLAREDFVNRLQMALFGWIKKHPSKTGLLYVVDEAQIFMPSGAETASLGSSKRLIAQGRKYGLGMIIATQAPKGVHNQIISNCTTQFFGRQSAPATITAAREIMAAKGGGGDDIGRLKAGEFYYASEDTPKPVKIKTSLCLSSHPANPPSPESIWQIAEKSRSRVS